jgi:large subunit ribosomal protein L6e
VNGVPLRRVNQVYAIATSQKVDVSKVSVPAHIDDAYFKAPAEAKGKGVLDTGKAVGAVSDKRKADQKAIDDALMAAVKGVPQLEGYLKARFSLKKGDRPHDLKF